VDVDDSGGTREWTGPDNFSATGQEITLENVTVEATGTYKPVYTSACGTKSIAFFEVAVSPVKSGHTYMIQPYNTALKVELEDATGNNGTNVQVGANTFSETQRYIITLAEEKYFQTAPEIAPSKALDVYNISSDDGANIVIWDYWGGHGQNFEFKPAGNNTYNIIARHRP